MNRRTAGVLVGACLVLLAAPVLIVAQSAPGLEVSDFESRYVPEWSPRRGASSDHASDVNNRPAHFEISAAFRNTGTKAVASVSWEYLFFSDAQQTQLMLRLKFRDGKRIAPGELARPKRASVRGAATVYQAVRITRVVYADGTVWQAAKDGN